MSKPVSGTKAHPASKRERILDETFILLGERGYRGLSFQDLARQCGLTKQGILHYFPTKPILLLALLDERDASIEAFLLDHLSSQGFETAGDVDARRAILQESLVKVVEQMLQIPGLIRLHVVLRAEAMGSDNPAKNYFLERDRATLDWLGLRLTALTHAPTSSARQILAVMLGLQQQWLQVNYEFDLLVEWRAALSSLLHQCPG